MASSSSFLSIYLALVLLLSSSSSSCLFNHSQASLLAEPAKPPVDDNDTTPNTVPAFPVQTTPQICRLDLSEELFGGVKDACGRNLDRSRCCPVLAAWLFAAHARSALQIAPAASLQQSSSSDLPFIPDDSQKCIDSLETSLQNRNIHIAQPNATCDTALCFCGIRLHQISSLSCPAAFNLTANRNATATPTPTAAVRELERNCHNSTYAGCTKCLGSLQKLKGGSKIGGDRASKIFSKDCQLMGLTWLLARNKTAYIPTVSAVLRALMYSAHPPHQSKCSPDQENMPLAVNSLQFDKSASPATATVHVWFTVLPLIYLLLLRLL